MATKPAPSPYSTLPPAGSTHVDYPVIGQKQEADVCLMVLPADDWTRVVSTPSLAS
jgi:hypothetical protein